MARVELLYFEGCPGYEALLARLPALVDDPAEIALRRIASPDEAQAERFLGSPTLRVDGEDVEPDADQRTDYGLRCRLYRTGEGHAHTPPDEWISRALRR